MTLRLQRRTYRGKIQKQVRRIASYVFHPVGVKCLTCGFLTRNGGETPASDRVLLATRGAAANCPPPREFYCARGQWIEYEVICAGTDEAAILDEITKTRRPCRKFLRYRPFWSPEEHKELLQKTIDRRERIIISAVSSIGGGIVGSAVTLLTKWLAKRWL